MSGKATENWVCVRPPVGEDGIGALDPLMLPPMALFGIRKFNSSEILGTAFAISPSICITAGHVVLDENGKFVDSFRLVPLNIPPIGDLPIPDGHVVYQNSPIIDAVTGYPGTDLVMLSVVAQAGWPDATFDPLAVTLEPPDIGESCLAVGFTVSKASSPDPSAEPAGDDGSVKGPNNTIRTYMEPTLWAESGKVTDLHLQQRDRVMAPFPCFGMEGNLRHQMSGSPVFRVDAGGRAIVCGVVSTGYEADEPFGYASLLWPLAAAPLPGRDNLNEPSLAVLALEGRIWMTGLDMIRISGWSGTKRAITLSGHARSRFLNENEDRYVSTQMQWMAPAGSRPTRSGPIEAAPAPAPTGNRASRRRQAREAGKQAQRRGSPSAG